ncbi:hypothetical protein IFM89_034887 [Coptis chinensis]|uniref:Uncharacterized protein n=1 Tax=Coptis chinensis TaxID=261450 RepID=A0A835I797_9MAGN|nr:hypothetical protein IFM89_034887 [Coptis chinensis]
MSMSSGTLDYDNEKVYGSGWGYNQLRDNDSSSGMISHPASSASYGSSYGYWMGVDQQLYGAPQPEPTYGQLYPSYEYVGTAPGFVALRPILSICIGLDSSIGVVVQELHEKWPDLGLTCYNMCFNRNEKDNLIESDGELHSLACYCFAKKIAIVEIRVVVCVTSLITSSGSISASSSSSSSSSVSGGGGGGVVVVRKPFKSDFWARNFDGGVGQRFALGAPEFCCKLIEYSIVSGYKYELIKNDEFRVTATGSRPCRHAIASIYCKGDSVYSYIEVAFLATSFSNTYSHGITAISRNEICSDVSDEVEIFPPDVKRAPEQGEDDEKTDTDDDDGNAEEEEEKKEEQEQGKEEEEEEGEEDAEEEEDLEDRVE